MVLYCIVWYWVVLYVCCVGKVWTERHWTTCDTSANMQDKERKRKMSQRVLSSKTKM